MKAAEEKAQIREPAPLNGQLDKRAAGFALGVGSGWREHYAEVRSPGFLHFYKDRRAAEATRGTDPSYSSDPNTTIVDLRLVNSFAVATAKGGKDSYEMDLVTSDEPVKIRCVPPPSPPPPPLCAVTDAVPLSPSSLTSTGSRTRRSCRRGARACPTGRTSTATSATSTPTASVRTPSPAARRSRRLQPPRRR